jgi:hypothetical protein
MLKLMVVEIIPGAEDILLVVEPSRSDKQAENSVA